MLQIKMSPMNLCRTACYRGQGINVFVSGIPTSVAYGSLANLYIRKKL